MKDLQSRSIGYDTRAHSFLLQGAPGNESVQEPEIGARSAT